jgi:serine/threonine protein kinase
MQPDRWKQIQELYESAIALPPEKRAEFLAQACPANDGLRDEVQSLLTQQADSFLESAPLSAIKSLSPGVRLGNFDIAELIGRGGMGEVYRARDSRLKRDVAIKVLPAGLARDADRRARFVQEAKAASGLNHPNIVTIHEIGEQDGRTYIVMELVDGKPLNELIPRKGMRLTEALRIAVQVADALAAAHAAGIVHRDLKPANIKVDSHGRVRVLDFGLAKLTASVTPDGVGADEATRTLTVNQPVTEEGVIVGSVPYMSPEQAEGKVVDPRSDIFSFGAVLYEMVTGQRAFRGESRISTLAAIVEKEPQPPSAIASTTPLELERLILRCLRKEINRRSQNMSDVRLALEELRDESESGKLPRPAVDASASRRPWRWPALAIASLLIAAAAVIWIYLNRLGTQPRGPNLVRLSPDDGYSYGRPAISPDGGFVAYISDRSGDNQLWLQQVGGGDPILLTHSSESVSFPSFFPDGRRILYISTSGDGRRSSIEAISALGGEPRVLIQGGRMINYAPLLSPDGRQIAYFEYIEKYPGVRLMTASSNGGQPQELSSWRSMMGPTWSGFAAWTSDSRYVLCTVTERSRTTNADELEWFAYPSDGGKPFNTGAGNALRAAGLGEARPEMMKGDRVLFIDLADGRQNVWEIRLSPGSWRAQGVPHQLTSGTLIERPASISSTGTVALEVGNTFSDLYLIPLSSATGQPTGAARKLTKDLHRKDLSFLEGDPRSVYFKVTDVGSPSLENTYHALNLESGKETLVASGIRRSTLVAISSDGRQVAYSVAESDSYSIRVGNVGAGEMEARVACKRCGLAFDFSPDGRFLFHSPEYSPETRFKPDPKRKLTVRLLELASGQDRPWAEHPTHSAIVDSVVSQDSAWVVIELRPPGKTGSWRKFLVPWREEPVPQSVLTSGRLIEISRTWRGCPGVNFVYGFEGSKLLATHIDPKSGELGEPREIALIPGSPVVPKPDENTWDIRGPGLVFTRDRTVNSVWLMDLPH